MNQELEKLLRDITDPKSRDNAKALFDLVAGTSQKAEDVRKGLLAVRRAFVDVVGESRELTQSFASALQEVSKYNIGLSEARKAQRKLLSLSQKFQDNTSGLTKLSVSELKNLKEKAEQEKARLEDSFAFLKNEYNLENLSDKAFSKKVKQLKKLGKISEEEQSIFEQGITGFENTQKYIDSISLATDDQKELNKITGLTGAVLDNLNRIGVRALGGLGVNLGALQEDFEEAQNAVDDTANKIRRINPKDAQSWVSKFKVFKSALPGIGKAAVTAFVDPLVTSAFTVDKLVDAFQEVNKASVNYQRLTGQTDLVNANLNKRLTTSIQYLQLSAKLTEEIGFNANNTFSKDVIAGAAELQNLMGLSAEQSGKLAILTQVGNKNIDNTVDNIVDQVSAFNKSNRTAISQGVILRDVAGTSDDILVSLGNQPGAIAKAASAARRLGLSLQEVDSIASSLLDFESSIQSELEAQLLTGKNINLTRARELALSNDLEGLGKEIFNNSASILEFSTQNRIQQEAQAKALGLTRQQLAKVALQRGIEAGITNEQLESAAGITAEDLKRTEAMERLKIAVQKVAQALVGPAEFLASMAQNAGVLYGTITLIAGIKLGQLIMSVMSLSSGLAGAAAGAGALSAFITPGRLIAGLAVAAAAIGLVTAGIKKAKEINDGIISPDRGLVVSGPKGSIQLDKKDSIVAGTNLVNNNRNTDRTERLLESILTAVEKGGNMYMDSNKVGTALVLGSYKTS